MYCVSHPRTQHFLCRGSQQRAGPRHGYDGYGLGCLSCNLVALARSRLSGTFYNPYIYISGIFAHDADAPPSGYSEAPPAGFAAQGMCLSFLVGFFLSPIFPTLSFGTLTFSACWSVALSILSRAHRSFAASLFRFVYRVCSRLLPTRLCTTVYAFVQCELPTIQVPKAKLLVYPILDLFQMIPLPGWVNSPSLPRLLPSRYVRELPKLPIVLAVTT